MSLSCEMPLCLHTDDAGDVRSLSNILEITQCTEWREPQVLETDLGAFDDLRDQDSPLS